MTITPAKTEFPRPNLPWNWMRDRRISNAYRNAETNLLVIYSVENRDGDDWLHVSLSHTNKMPTYHEIKKVKELFVGDRNAYMVFPTSENFVNAHKYCLHLWCNLTNPQPLPEFSNTLTGQKMI